MSPPCLMVTAGPSREYLDDIRYLSNASSGRMGIEVAAAAARRGWRVMLLLGPTDLVPPPRVDCRRFESAADLDRIAEELWPEVAALVAAAAVADFRPSSRIPGKRKKAAGDWRVDLVPTPDVLLERSRAKGGRVLVGFALESPPSQAEARRKLMEKKLDLIILNSAANLASAGGDFDWIEGNGTVRSFRSVAKAELAAEIVEFVAARIPARAT